MKIVFALLTLVVTGSLIATGFLRPVASLDQTGNLVLMSIVAALGLWVLRPGGLPYSAGCAVLLAGAMLAKIKPAVALSGYGTQALWVLVPALYLGFVLHRTGLGKRIVYRVLSILPPSYFNIVLGWAVVGVALSILTPSIAVRVATVIPISVATVEACRLKTGSREASLITLVAFGMALIPGVGWLTGSLWGPIFTGMFPPEIRSLCDSASWFKGMALFWAVVSVLYIAFLYLMLRPTQPLQMDRGTFKTEYARLGKISWEQAVTLLVLVAAFIMFATERLHGLPTAATALAAFFVLAACGVIKSSDIGTGVNWDIIIFLGAVIGLPEICRQAGIAQWLTHAVTPTVNHLGPHPLLLLVLFMLAYWVVRLVDVGWGYTIAAFIIPVMVPLYRDFHIHPIVITVILVVGGNSFFFAYQQPFAIMAESISQGTAWKGRHLFVAGCAYAVACLLSLLAAVPYWKAIGFLP